MKQLSHLLLYVDWGRKSLGLKFGIPLNLLLACPREGHNQGLNDVSSSHPVVPFFCKTETTRWGVNTVILLPSVSSVASVTSKTVATTTCKQGDHPLVVWSRPLDGYATCL